MRISIPSLIERREREGRGGKEREEEGKRERRERERGGGKEREKEGKRGGRE